MGNRKKYARCFSNGENISQCGLAYHRRKYVSLIFQRHNLIDYMTPIENVALTAKQDVLPLLLRLGLTAEEACWLMAVFWGGHHHLHSALLSLNGII